MPNLAAKFSSEYLTAEQMAASLRSLPAVLRELFGECTFTLYYGWGAHLHTALYYAPMGVETSVLPSFIDDSIDQRIIVPGASDLIIKSPNDELELVFCHESDIHVDGKNIDVMQRFIAAEPFREMRFYSQEELKLQYPELDPSRHGSS